MNRNIFVHTVRSVSAPITLISNIYIKPKSDPKNRFDYDNLIVSCNGKECLLLGDDVDDYEGDVHSCGHKKNETFDEVLFVSPVTEKNTSDFFHFDKEDGRIVSNPEFSEPDRKRAEYSIGLLRIDNARLNHYRLNARKAMERELMIIREEQGMRIVKEKLNDLLSLNSSKSKLEPFITFLRFCFHNFLEN